jgi:hypothetical protein
MKSIVITCASCGQKVEKRAAEIERQKKKGKKLFYCNLKCHGKNKKNIEHISKFHDNFKITKYIRQPDEHTDFRWYIKNIIKNSKKKKQSYDIDLQYLKDLWELQHGICPITGCKLTLRTHNYKQIRGPYQASLDRIDNTKGYIKGNVRFVSLMFNYARNIFSDEEVIDFCKTVAKNF